MCDDEGPTGHVSPLAEDTTEDDRGENEPSSLEKILPPLPASQREVFLHVHAISGLAQPFVAKGNTVLSRVFWGGQEVSGFTLVTAKKLKILTEGVTPLVLLHIMDWGYVLVPWVCRRRTLGEGGRGRGVGAGGIAAYVSLGYKRAIPEQKLSYWLQCAQGVPKFPYALPVSCAA